MLPRERLVVYALGIAIAYGAFAQGAFYRDQFVVMAAFVLLAAGLSLTSYRRTLVSSNRKSVKSHGVHDLPPLDCGVRRNDEYLWPAPRKVIHEL